MICKTSNNLYNKNTPRKSTSRQNVTQHGLNTEAMRVLSCAWLLLLYPLWVKTSAAQFVGAVIYAREVDSLVTVMLCTDSWSIMQYLKATYKAACGQIEAQHAFANRALMAYRVKCLVCHTWNNMTPSF